VHPRPITSAVPVTFPEPEYWVVVDRVSGTLVVTSQLSKPAPEKTIMAVISPPSGVTVIVQIRS
jgi:hypothetical protein